jgi:hypothetical protein
MPSCAGSHATFARVQPPATVGEQLEPVGSASNKSSSSAGPEALRLARPTMLVKIDALADEPGCWIAMCGRLHTSTIAATYVNFSGLLQGSPKF